jgi:dipeptidyl aminopeptidase/acylaminoacyl peptidase
MKHLTVAFVLTISMSMLVRSTWGQQQRGLAPQDYYALRSISDPQASPDGHQALYVVTTANQKQNKRHSDIWLASVDGSQEPRQLTNSPQSSRSPRWAPDGKAIAFLSARSSSPDGKIGETQVQFLALGGGEARSLTSLKNGVESFSWSPDGTKLVCVSTWGPSDSSPLDPDKSDTLHFVHPTYKWNGRGFFNDRRMHLWLVDVKSGTTKQITEGSDWNDREPRWSPDSTRIAFVSDRTGKFFDDVGHTTAHVWVIPSAGGIPVEISHGDENTQGSPQWSSDGRWIAYLTNKFEEDPPRLLMASSADSTKTAELATDLDLSVQGLEWGDDDRALYFLSNVRGENHLFRVDVTSGKASQVTSGERTIDAISLNNARGSLVYVVKGFQQPGDLYSANLDGKEEKRLTNVNECLLKDRLIQAVERMTYQTEDGLSIDGFLVKPIGWQSGKKYPMILYIHGGPEGMFGTDWLIRAQIFAARGWSVFFTNPRGSTGYGSKFMSSVVKEWGGKVYSDLMSGVDAVLKQNAWIDPSKLGVIGCSFGGYMTNWIVSNTTRFSAAVPMCSISDYISDEATRDDYYGHAHDFGGDLYQNFDLYWKYSPIRKAMNVKTPTLILHGEADQRVPLEQAEEWFRALQHFHAPSEFVIFPHESHSGLSDGEPRHVVEAMNWQIYWFERYLDGNRTAVPPDAIRRTNGSPPPINDAP